ncbi:SRPBCC family protein [Stutzerimonas tarimensis]|uniref:SRPBCC family protein n=1 Tax=Stutzerimonas tarimensis TaxID=1507735 RepID=A0ABV7T6F9_9GAMM
MEQQQELHNRIAARLLDHIEQRSTDQADDVMRVPSASYTDPARWEREMEVIFKRLPILTAMSGEIPQSGSYKTLELLGTPILLTRLRDGSVRAMLNACGHRGMKLADGQGKCEKFACPYHAWLYSNDGELVRIAAEDTYGKVEKAAFKLKQLPVYERAGMIFVVLKPGLEVEFEGFFAGMLEDIEGLGLKDWYYCGSREIHGANWKVAYDGYLEGYHFAAAHPDTIHQRTFSNLAAYHFYGPHQLIGFAQKTMQEKLGGLPKDQLHQYENNGYDFVRTLFPNVSIFVAPEITQVAQLIPGPTPGENRTVLHFLHPRAPENDEQRQANEQMMDWLRNVVQKEDYDLGLKVQEGLESGAFEFVTFGRNEPGNQDFHRTLDRYLAEAADESTDDEAAIRELLLGCAAAMDRRDNQALGRYFAEDASADYGELGTFQGLAAITEVIDAALGQCAGSQHLMSNLQIAITGDSASSRCYLQGLHLGKGEYAGRSMTLWGEYQDRLRKGPDGWRIVQRELVALHTEGDIGLGAK